MTGHEPHHSSTGGSSAIAVREYLFALTDGGGTVPPELGVARRLVERGHHVTVLADQSMAGQTRGTGAAFLPWTGPPAGELHDWGRQSPLSLARNTVEHMITGPGPSQARDVAHAIDGTRPELVLTSFFALGAMIAAEGKGVPFDVLLPNVYPLPAKGRPPGGAGLAPMGGPLGRLRDRMVQSGVNAMFDRYALAPANALRSGYGLGPIATIWEQLQHARLQLILSSEAFDFLAELPANARYLGPVLDDPAWAADVSWTEPEGEDPLVLVAMSSTFQNHVQCLQRIIDALGTLPVRGLVTTGPALAISDLTAPANVVVVAAAPHAEVMRRASLVVTHGGHGTVMKALAAGLPLVVLHHGRDQADNAVRVRVHGAGRTVPRGASSARIAEAVTTVLGSPSYASAAAELGRAVSREADAVNARLLAAVEG
ncbi:glycosyl transferase family protein [Arthrobacter sp. PAMC 25486]|uniref:glycosyltransferase n=1 Tax=Arthrobacter sp. PAMC 25486 TaxID=1494608 RepID=UPI000535E20D|nr:nucleotide disphospho-sugar-binding domain-containing protein [Arthrobacter sp. PAMC 25486]AIY02105.1 glycosyl transferase family protein [Arthrobacter sp. PAMC 25486]